MVLACTGNTQNSILAQSALETVFGLGDYEGPLRLTITWPSGTVQVLEDMEPGRIEITETPPAAGAGKL